MPVLMFLDVDVLLNGVVYLWSRGLERMYTLYKAILHLNTYYIFNSMIPFYISMGRLYFLYVLAG